MNVKKFKLGDRIRVTKEQYQNIYMGKVGTIIQVGRIKNGFSIYWDYKVTFDDKTIYDYIFGPEEIEREFKKGEQLLFNFMT